MKIGTRSIGVGNPAYIIAEMSANHGQSFERAVAIIHAMKDAGADAVKLQTYTPDTITIDCDNRYFTDCLKGTLWEGKTLYELYAEAFTPWDWQPKLKEEAEELGMDFFSTPFDVTAVDFLEQMDVPAYKVASFEIVHLPLIRRIAATGKPMILSTGMATKEEITEAIDAARSAGVMVSKPVLSAAEASNHTRASGLDIALLKCTSAYPARMEDANLRTIPAMMEEFGVPVGLSDHTMGHAAPVTAITLGASIIEKHFVMDREKDKGPDSAFSMEPQEFRDMVDAVRAAERDPQSAPIEEKALGAARFRPTDAERKSLLFRPSIFVVEDVRAGEPFTERNLRIIRPGDGLAPKELPRVLGTNAAKNIERGTPLSMDLLA